MADDVAPTADNSPAPDGPQNPPEKAQVPAVVPVEDLSKLKSIYDQRVDALTRQVGTLQTQLAQMDDHVFEQTVASVEDPVEQARMRSERTTTRAAAEIAAEREQAARATGVAEFLARQHVAEEFAAKYGVPEALLLRSNASTVEGMEEHAKVLRSEIDKVAKAKSAPKAPAPDSGDSAAPVKPESKEKAFENTGDIFGALKAERAKRAAKR